MIYDMKRSNLIKISLTEEQIRNTVRQKARDWFPELANAEVLPIEGKDVDTKYDKAIVNTARYDKYKGELYLHIGGAFYPHGDRDEVECSVNHGWVKTNDWKKELKKAVKELEAEVEKTYKEIIDRKKSEQKKNINEGSWGYKPLDSDHALDFRDDLYFRMLDSTIKEMNNTNDSSYLYAYLGTFNELLKLLLQTNYPVFIGKNSKKYDKAVQRAFALIKKDKNWQDGYDKPKEIAAAIRKTEQDYNQLKEKYSRKWRK